MTEQNKKAPAAGQSASPAAARQASGKEKAGGAVVPDIPAAPTAPVAPSAKAAPAAKKAPAAAARAVRRAPARKPTQVEQTVAKHQKVLAEELVKAQAINYEQPKVMKQPAAPKKAAGKAAGKQSAAKPAKVKKPRLVRDSYAMPEIEYAQIALLKKRLAALGRETKKSELLRGGIAALAAFNDDELKNVMGRIERIKTGRPAKK